MALEEVEVILLSGVSIMLVSNAFGYTLMRHCCDNALILTTKLDDAAALR